MQARLIGATKLIRCEIDWRELWQGLAQLRRLSYNDRLNRIEEHKRLRFVFGIAVGERNVVVGYLDYMALIHAAGEAPDINELSFIPAKQIFRVLSFHFDAPVKRAIAPFSLLYEACPEELSSDHWTKKNRYLSGSCNVMKRPPQPSSAGGETAMP